MLDKSVADAFKGRCCVVTGAASGIGLALSEALLQSGANVFLADMSEKNLAAAAEKFSSCGARVRTTVVDVSKEDQVRGLIETAAVKHGKLDYVFNNAGVGWGGEFVETPTDAWRRVIDIDLWSAIYGTLYAAQIMRRQGGGHIVNTASITGIVPFVYESLYSAAKHAVVGLSLTSRYELADSGVRVTVVCPGGVATPIFHMSEAEALKEVTGSITAADAAERILNGVARNDALIVFPDNVAAMWRSYWKSPEAWESGLLAWARGRKASGGLAWHPDEAFARANFPADYVETVYPTPSKSAA